MFFEGEEERQVNEMKRLQKQLLEYMHGMLRRIGDDDELLADVATIYRKLYLALHDVGFTEEQALMIVAHQGLGGMQVRHE